MPQMNRRTVLLGLTALPLAGCVATPPTLEPIDYGMRQDGGFVLPAVSPDEVPAGLRRQLVAYETERPVGSIVITRDQRALYLVLRGGFALRYGVAIGRGALAENGLFEVYRLEEWPGAVLPQDPARDVSPADTEGLPVAPLGARVLYLRDRVSGTDRGLRIHGTRTGALPEGMQAVEYFRLINHDMIDLFARVEAGALVSVE